ncbi:glycosyltransferase [Aequorivita capsosiphonis]|uniref:glycosyltransferase n=1 Tax=Aequorivita capsosiphonis TaxID=487317 RepID=UPI00047E22C1|nr:glycosyltransferase [Aequorivita capsosiphonis]
MKLLHVFSAPQSAYIFMEGQLQYMHKHGCEVTVVIPADRIINPKFKTREPNIKVINAPIKRNIALFNDIYTFFCLLWIFIKIKPDIIHLHTPKASLIGALAARVLFKKNIVYQMHGLVSIRGNQVEKGLLYHMEKLTCTLATKIFAVSKSIRDFAIENEYTSIDKISVIENGTINGIEYHTRFNPKNILKNVKNLDQKTENKFVIGFVGRVSDDKGIYEYLDVIARCRKNSLETIGVVIGPDESNGLFGKHMKELDLAFDTDILYYGDQTAPESYMIYFDVLLLPTKREGFGLVATEVNALEIPVIGYEIPGFSDAVINEETGFLVPYMNVDALYKTLIKYYFDPKLKLKHGVNGRKRVIKDFDSNKIWESLLAEYQKM